MTPPCDSPNCSFLPLSDISNALKKKSTYLIEQPCLIFVCVKGELKTDNNLCVCVCVFLCGGCMRLCVC